MKERIFWVTFYPKNLSNPFSRFIPRKLRENIFLCCEGKTVTLNFAQ